MKPTLRLLANRRQTVRWAVLAVLGLLCGAGIWLTSDSATAQNAKKKKDRAAKVETVRTIPGAGQKLGPAALAQIIDQEISRRLKEEKVPTSGKTDDAEFFRRVYLDLVGVIPPAEKVKAFLQSADANKRARAVEELLADPRYGKSMAEIWTNVMVPRESNNRRLDASPLQQWMSAQFNANKPWDKLVYELVTASGPIDKNGAVTYFVGNPTVDKITDSVTRLFMGVRLECAQCHNHPFTTYKQNEYWAMAAFFMKVRMNANPQQAQKKNITIEVSETAFAAKKKKKKGLPESAKIVPARFLEGEQPKMKPNEPSRPVLAAWMTSAKNPYFARAMVNKLWHHFFGRGLVNPVDDMHADNPASHPELLGALAEQFKTHNFDVKYLIRAIVLSDAYQRSSRPAKGNELDSELFSHMPVKVMTPEQLYDSWTAVVGVPKKQAGFKNKAGKKGGAGGPRAVPEFLPHRGGGEPAGVSGGHPARSAADEFAAAEQQQRPGEHRRHCPHVRPGPGIPVSGDRLAHADRRGGESPDGVHQQAVLATDGIQRHPLGAAELRGVRDQPLTFIRGADIPVCRPLGRLESLPHGRKTSCHRNLATRLRRSLKP